MPIRLDLEAAVLMAHNDAASERPRLTPSARQYGLSCRRPQIKRFSAAGNFDFAAGNFTRNAPSTTWRPMLRLFTLLSMRLKLLLASMFILPGLVQAEYFRLSYTQHSLQVLHAADFHLTDANFHFLCDAAIDFLPAISVGLRLDKMYSCTPPLAAAACVPLSAQAIGGFRHAGSPVSAAFCCYIRAPLFIMQIRSHRHVYAIINMGDFSRVPLTANFQQVCRFRAAFFTPITKPLI